MQTDVHMSLIARIRSTMKICGIELCGAGDEALSSSN